MASPNPVTAIEPKCVVSTNADSPNPVTVPGIIAVAEPECEESTNTAASPNPVTAPIEPKCVTNITSSNPVNAIEPSATTQSSEQNNSVNTMGMVFTEGRTNIGETSLFYDQALTGSLLAVGGGTQLIKEFDGSNLESWVRDLNDEMAVACCLAIKDLKVGLKERNVKCLTFDQVESIFNNCNYIVKDEKNSKHVSGMKTYEEKDLTNTNISTWIRDLFQKQDEQKLLTNSLLAQMMVKESFLNQLAVKVIEHRASAEDLPTPVDSAKAKILELGTVHFPGTKGVLSLSRLQVFALSCCKESGIEIEYKKEDFRPFRAAIDTTIATKAREKLGIQETFDF